MRGNGCTIRTLVRWTNLKSINVHRFSRFANHCNIVHYNMVQGTRWHHEKRTQSSPLFLFCRARPSVFGMGAKRSLPNKKKRRPFVLLFCTPLRDEHLLRLVALCQVFLFPTHHDLSHFCLLCRHQPIGSYIQIIVMQLQTYYSFQGTMNNYYYIDMDSNIWELAEQVANFAASAAEKLRAQHSACVEMMVFAYTNRFKENEPQTYGSSIAGAADRVNREHATLHFSPKSELSRRDTCVMLEESSEIRLTGKP